MSLFTRPDYFRTYEQVKQHLLELQKAHPDLVQVRDIGDSGDKIKGKADRDIWAVTLTNKNAKGAKPVTEFIAGLHAREIANPELLLRWADKLVAGFGKDPEATALLNSREIDLIPMVNPDGHASVEKGFETHNPVQILTRKDKAHGWGFGTDINRNFDFHWGGPGASRIPFLPNYRGKSAASEPETQAVQNYTAVRKPNELIDWHSFSGLVMYPWGDTKNPAPDKDGLDRVARQFAAKNGYIPQQAISLYATTGTSDDWAYGTLGTPSWAIETGKAFIQNKEQFKETQKKNEPVLTYAAKIADAPYERSKGPEITRVRVEADGSVTARAVQKALPASLPIPKNFLEQLGNRFVPGKLPIIRPSSTIAGAELITDPSAPFGSGVPLHAKDGNFTAAHETLTGVSDAVKALAATAPVQNVHDGKTLLYVRAHDSNGNWGPATAQWLPAAATSTVGR